MSGDPKKLDWLPHYPDRVAHPLAANVMGSSTVTAALTAPTFDQGEALRAIERKALVAVLEQAQADFSEWVNHPKGGVDRARVPGADDVVPRVGAWATARRRGTARVWPVRAILRAAKDATPLRGAQDATPPYAVAPLNWVSRTAWHVERILETWPGQDFAARLRWWVENGCNDTRAAARYRTRARVVLLFALQALDAEREEADRAWQEFRERRWQVARQFVVEALRSIGERRASESDVDDLKRHLVEHDDQASNGSPEPGGVSDATLRAAASGNALLKGALAALDAWSTKPKRNGADHPALVWRTYFAFHWPSVYAEWSKARQAESLARVPTPLVIGEGAIAPLFGRSLPPGTNVAPRRGVDGRLRNVVIARRATQLDLLVPARLELNTATNEQVLDTLAKVLSNREWRFFVSGLVAMHDDYATGRAEVPGGFFYTPSRFGELLGLSDREATRNLDHSLETLMGVSLTATMKRGGKDFRITAEALLVDGKGTLAALGKRGRGRPSARLYRFQDFILGMLKGDGSWFPVTKDMLRPPSGVDPRTYDDAFKLETVLAAYARTEVKKAKKPGLVWRRKADTLIEASGIAWQGARPHVKRERLRELLEVLNSTGRVVATYDQATHAVSYDLPAVRPAWAPLVDSKPLKTLRPG